MATRIIKRGNIIPEVLEDTLGLVNPLAVAPMRVNPPIEPTLYGHYAQYYFSDTQALTNFLSDASNFQSFISANPKPIVSTGVTFDMGEPTDVDTYLVYTGSTTTFEASEFEQLPAVNLIDSIDAYGSEQLTLNDGAIRIIAKGSRLVWQRKLPDDSYEDILST